MKLVIFGLTVSSSWGNGHATLWRGLCASLARRGHDVIFFERDVSWYSDTRDLCNLPGGGELILYSGWNEIEPLARRHVLEADAAIVTSYCPDAIASAELLFGSAPGLKVFYDLDSPVTLSRLANSEKVEYLPSDGLRDFDLVLSYAGGKALTELTRVLGAKRVAPLYGSVDPSIHKPVTPDPAYRADMSYLGTYSPDRDEALNQLFIEPARRLTSARFLIGGSLYGHTFPWLPNIFFMHHLPPARHPAFYCSSGVTLNVTRRPMAAMGFCPSGRIFEASACGVPVFSDYWEGIETFYRPGSEILLGRTPEDTLDVLSRSPEDLARMGAAARERTLQSHTSDKRAQELERVLENAHAPVRASEAGKACGA